jgi:endonuclease IV
MVLPSLKTILFHKSIDKKEYQKRFYDNGSSPRNINMNSDYNWETAQPATDISENRIDENVSDIQKIIDLCNKHDINLIIFTNPLHILTYENAVKNGYLEFLYKLSDITEYYNFSGINDITTNNNNYFETSHYKIEVGDIIIDAIFNNANDMKLLSQGFGYFVTKNNRDDLHAILDNQIIQYTDN